ncbi:DUF6328 family protein [Pseudonocardia dioxanivorans]|uniref:Sodium:proton antiporter n=1 Tax=Pseudonocardia dioxanivorans (strain ATCC 55486 / DSM 44775 / JCM 13855 / CB1190) TaxID=675635 RepID=F4CVR6_PSEUX|nr:DUF6328 family protein [Pseudonocardia dioxanivorans]AEA24626.1 hypothetical protein Psed_2422 [Pseudonocardia dioxanivorans CB1190]
MDPPRPPSRQSDPAPDEPADAAWNRAVRDETETERLDRNWNDLLQELRVAQTGVQLLTGLLLTVPFQSRFPELVTQQRVVYLVAISLSIIATGLLIAPVLLHRLLFRRHARRWLVASGQRFAVVGLATLGLAVVAVVDLIFDVVLGTVAGVIAAACALAVFSALWLVFPMVVRRRAD